MDCNYVQLTAMRQVTHKRKINCLASYQLSSLLSAQRKTIMGFVPLPERCGINDNNSVLYQSFCPNQLVIGGVVDYINNTSLFGGTWKNFRRN